MKPKKLIMKNFGPYIQETLDFDQVATTGLFLISGKTGAGKTTIFDGMTFALFGETSGNLRAGKEMRSMFASPSEETSVSFTFAHQSLFYEILRRPEQILSKKRGDGVTNQAAKVQLTIFDAAGKELKQLRKRNEVDQFIKELLQLDAKQFFQIMMLPQGEFRNFLIATSNDKEKVLRNLFGTQLYQGFNEWLKEQQKAQNKTLEQQQQLAEQLLSRFDWQQEQPVFSTAEALEAWTADLEQQTAAIATMQTQKSEIDQAYQKTQTLFYQAKERENLRQEQQVLLEQQVALEASAPMINQKKHQLEALSWAAEKQPIWQRRMEKDAAYRHAQNQAAAAQDQLRSIQLQQQDWQAQRPIIEQRKEALEQATMKQRMFDSLLPIAQQAHKQQQALSDLRQEAQRQQTKRQAFEREESQFAAQQAQWTAEIEAAGDHQTVKIQLLECKNLLEKWLEIKEQYAKATADHQQRTVQEQALINKQTHLDKQETTLTVTLKTETSQNAKMQIARLQLLLEPDEPCPVCGATDHPNLQAHASYTIEDIMESEQRLLRTQKELTTAKEQLSANHTLLQQCQQQLAETHTLIEERQQAKEKAWQALFAALQVLEDGQAKITEATAADYLKQRMIVLDQQTAAVQKAQQQLQTLAQQQKTISNEKQALIEAEAAVTTKQQLAEGRMAALMEQLSGYSIQEIETQRLELKKLIQQQTNEIDSDAAQGAELEKNTVILSEKVDNLQTFSQEKQQEWQQANKDIDGFLQEAGYTEAQFEALLSRLSEKEALSMEVKQYQQDLYATQQRLATLEQRLADAEPFDSEVLSEQCQQLEATREQMQEQIIQKQEKRRNNQLIYQELHMIYAQNVQAMDQLSQLQQLAETINGENSKKTSLERYVLQRYLEEILVVANARLARLTRGRYQFELADKVGSYRSSTGLEIDIYDDNAGQVRRAHTLSGGESFIAALALAISLADVIQAKAGGIEIEALFIDEGFGSLDEESLEMAMEALEMIESEGRMIGIISHVRELRTRITQQVFVETNGGGQSQIRIKE